MPLKIKGTTYTAPSEAGTSGLTGRELIEIEDYFKLDGLTLMATLAGDDKSVARGYTRAKAIFALAWVCMSRAGEPVSISDVLDDLSLGDIDIVDDEEDNDSGKGEEANSLEAATETE